ncbi:MAG: hypothetical protein HY331_07785 [Chloroflexi bacterium]|nr:hypothetical protein [Chloroflexota bacterium]
MRLFFDMDNTLISDCAILRPRVREVFERLTTEGHEIYVWSGVGIRWKEVHQHELHPFVTDCYRKPLNGVNGNRRTDGIPTTIQPDLVVDDIAPIVEEYGGVVVRPYFWEIESDREMDRVYQIIQEVVATGASADKAYRPGRRRVMGPPTI